MVVVVVVLVVLPLTASCVQLRVHHNNVSNPLEPNADGIDIDATQDALIEDNYFNVGDDALCVKSGIDWFGRQYARPAKNIMFRRNTIGSEMSGGVVRCWPGAATVCECADLPALPCCSPT